MSRAGGVPNAWDDDDWETQVDRSEGKQTQAAPQPNLNRQQQRLQQHAEANRRLWESADSKEKEIFHYVEAAGGGVPLTTAFKPQVKVLSRKPAIAKKDPVTGLSQLSLDDDDDASGAPVVQMTPDEIRAKQKRDREEKQRRYDEARAKIFGESAPSSRGSSPGTGTVTPPRQDGRGAYRGRGRGRGGGYNNNSSNNNSSGYNYNSGNVSSEGSGQQFEPRRPANQPGSRRELFDPSSAPRPDSLRRGGREGSGSDSSMRGQAVRDEYQAIRAPRGPDGSGRGGFGFAQRGNRAT